LEGSERTRTASLNLLQRLFTYLYYFTESTALLEKTASLARELGGELVITELEPKWKVLRSLLGWKATRRVISGGQTSKLMARIYWDRLLYGIYCGNDNVAQNKVALGDCSDAGL
jgi:hypothetical protein